MNIKDSLRVLMITGVYYPEVNGAVLQCKQLVKIINASIIFTVLAETSNKALNEIDLIDGILVSRTFIPRGLNIGHIIGIFKFLIRYFLLLRKIDIIHIHGFSKRNALLIAFGFLSRKKIILKMSSYGIDDAMSIKKRSTILWILYKCCHAFIGLSPAFSWSYECSGLPLSKYNFIPNGVDTVRFSPFSREMRVSTREKYGFSQLNKIIIFVGHFSSDKRPLLLYHAWDELNQKNIYTDLLFIGLTTNSYEVDGEIVELIKKDALIKNNLTRIHFVEKTLEIENFMKLADIYVQTSLREGLPNALLESMSTGLPCIVSYLTGVTDWLIVEGKTGVLFKTNEPKDLADKIASLVIDDRCRQQIGNSAREYIKDNFSAEVTAKAVTDLYRNVYGKSKKL